MFSLQYLPILKAWEDRYKRFRKCPEKDGVYLEIQTKKKGQEWTPWRYKKACFWNKIYCSLVVVPIKMANLLGGCYLSTMFTFNKTLNCFMLERLWQL